MSSIESIALAPTAAQAAAKDRADLIRHQAALRAVLDKCDFIDGLLGKYEPYKIAQLIRAAITTALETKP